MKLYYRLSDASYKKPKLPGATKRTCLLNFLRAFDIKEQITLVLDNCEESLNIDLVKFWPYSKIYTMVGNAGSLICAIRHAVYQLNKDEIVYFSEDDYLHRPNASSLVEEGLQLADYVTLYDHPDKYMSYYDGGEVSKVLRKKHSHWRYTISTCMTFATKVRTLEEDLKVWEKYTAGTHPHDHLIFQELKTAGRTLAVCIPGAACHMDMTFSGHMNKLMMEDWAIDLLCEELEYQLSDEIAQIKDAIFVNKPQGWDRLKMLDALCSIKKAPL